MSAEQPRPPTDYRRERRRTERQLLLLVLGTLLIFGGFLIYLIYGGTALITGLLCLVPGAGVILFLWGLLSLIERWVGE
ncbi:MAG: hypothetical protein D6775_16620 [Caldilineae bacterium]|nr:MAG: hypothetical protein D6775_16620 [Caldilineae bacterium]